MNICRRWFFLLMLLFLFVVNDQSQSNKGMHSRNRYIGKKYGQVLPDNLRDGMASMIDSQYAICAINNRKNGPLKMIWFEKYLYRDSSGQAYFEILDVIDLPPLKKKQSLSIGCLLNEVFDREIIAIDHWNGKEYICDNIIHAWRANRKTGKIEIIPVENVQTRHEYD
jgi:hypothetical protein